MINPGINSLTPTLSPYWPSTTPGYLSVRVNWDSAKLHADYATIQVFTPPPASSLAFTKTIGTAALSPPIAEENISLPPGMYRLDTTIFKSAGPTQIWRGEEVVYVAPGRLSVYQRDLDLYDSTGIPNVVSSLGLAGLIIDSGPPNGGTPVSFSSTIGVATGYAYTIDGGTPDADHNVVTNGTPLGPGAKIMLDSSLDTVPDGILNLSVIAYNAFGVSPVSTFSYYLSDAVYVDGVAPGPAFWGIKVRPLTDIGTALSRASLLAQARMKRVSVRIAPIGSRYLSGPGGWELPDGVNLSGNWDHSTWIQNGGGGDPEPLLMNDSMHTCLDSPYDSAFPPPGNDPRATLRLTGPGTLGNDIDNILFYGPSGDSYTAAAKIINTASRQILFRSVAFRGVSTAPQEGVGVLAYDAVDNITFNHCFINGSASTAPTAATGLSLFNTAARISNCMIDGGSAGSSTCGIQYKSGVLPSPTIIEKTKIWGGDAPSTYGVVLTVTTPLAQDVVLRNDIIHGGNCVGSNPTSAVMLYDGVPGAGRYRLLNNTLYAKNGGSEAVLSIAGFTNPQIINNLILTNGAAMYGVFESADCVPLSFANNAIFAAASRHYSQNGSPNPDIIGSFPYISNIPDLPGAAPIDPDPSDWNTNRDSFMQSFKAHLLNASLSNAGLFEAGILPADPLHFDVDFDGDLRGSAWTIGAQEFD
jgi:hypothetical protein